MLFRGGSFGVRGVPCIVFFSCSKNYSFFVSACVSVRVRQCEWKGAGVSMEGGGRLLEVKRFQKIVFKMTSTTLRSLALGLVFHCY